MCRLPLQFFMPQIHGMLFHLLFFVLYQLMHDRCKNNFHRVAHFSTGYYQSIGTRHESVRNHVKHIGEVSALGMPEADDHEAFIRCRNVARDKRIGGVNGSHALEVDIGA